MPAPLVLSDDDLARGLGLKIPSAEHPRLAQHVKPLPQCLRFVPWEEETTARPKKKKKPKKSGNSDSDDTKYLGLATRDGSATRIRVRPSPDGLFKGQLNLTRRYPRCGGREAAAGCLLAAAVRRSRHVRGLRRRLSLREGVWRQSCGGGIVLEVPPRPRRWFRHRLRTYVAGTPLPVPDD